MEGSTDFGSPMNENKSGKFPQLIKRDPKFRMRPMFGKIIVKGQRDCILDHIHGIQKNDWVTKRFYKFGLSSLIASSDHPSCLMTHDYRLIWAIRILQKGQPTPTNPQSNTSSSSIISGFFPQQRFCILLPHQSHYSSPYVVPALSEPGQLCLRWAEPNFVDNRASSSFLQRRWFNCS